jgi:uncharacterized protein (DUF58 family)
MRPAAGTLAVGAVLGLVGYLLDAEPLLAAGAGLFLLAGGCAAWVALAARGATVDRTVAARRVVEEQPLAVSIAVCAGAPGWPEGEVVDALLGRPVLLRPRARAANVRISVRFERRGARELAPPELRVRDALGLAERVVRGAEAAQVLVLPRTHPICFAGGAAGLRAGGARAEALDAGASLTELDGLRPYRQGAPAARIHWPAVARGAGLLERHFRPDAGVRPLVVLDASAPRDRDALDAAVRAAASLALELAGRGGCEVLLPGERRPRAVDPDLAAWPALHARFAVVEAGPAPALAAAGSRTGAVLYVAARPLRRTPPAAARVAGGPLLLVLPAALPGRAAAFTVAGCHGYAARAGRRAAA